MSDADSTDEMMEVERMATPLSGNRKVTKSAMEKKRRARINTSLTELKTMLSGIIQLKGERFDKMEKADILEWTVKYIKDLQNGTVVDHDVPSDDKYKVGFNSCVGEVLQYIRSNNAYDPEIRVKMLNHLAESVRTIDSPSPPRCCASQSPKLTNDNGFTNLANENNQPERFRRQNYQNTDTDCNNNAQTIQNLNCGQQINPRVSGQQDSIRVSGQQDNVQSIPNQASQSTPVIPSPLVPAGQITILVPANIFGSPDGTNCLIPVAVPSYSPNNQTLLVPSVNGNHAQQLQQQQQISPVYQTIQSHQITPVYIQTDNTFNQSQQKVSPTVQVFNNERQFTSEPVVTNEQYPKSTSGRHLIHPSSSLVTTPVPVESRLQCTSHQLSDTMGYSQEQKSVNPSYVYPNMHCNGHPPGSPDVWRPW